ncbi:MAG: hypothetical protein M1816_004694 [Peltula sp. TS41687]|nr:MAG: hypothetical protein M1816_004694 [Peltula sp. TS41687]
MQPPLENRLATGFRLARVLRLSPQSLSSNGKRGASADASEKAEQEHLGLGLREVAAEVPSQIRQIAELQEADTAVKLGGGTEEKGPDGVGKDEDG